MSLISIGVARYIVTDLPKALLGNGSVNMFQHVTIGVVFSVDKQQLAR
jgi:hypothetical protein